MRPSYVRKTAFLYNVIRFPERSNNRPSDNEPPVRSGSPVRGVALMLLLLTGIQQIGLSQNCRELRATYTVAESRCTATGSVKATATGGSGTYNYKMQGPTVVDYTSSSLITGLQPGTYTMTVKDVVTACETTITNVVIPGSYTQPRFGLTETDVTCNNGNDGVISVTGVQNGRMPFVYKIVSPSPMGVGTTSATGVFSGLTPGTYSVQMTDSCGSIQTRTISIQNYTWSITSATVTLSNCQNYTAQISLQDSKGNTNASGTAFTGWKYGVVRGPGDTVWSNNPSFAFSLGNKRTVKLIAKDKCGQIQSKTWTNPAIPSVGANVTISGQNCTTFNASITGQTNINNAQYCIVNAAGNNVPGQPCNTTGVFNGLPYGSYCIKVKENCYDTTMSRCFTQTKAVPAVDATASLSGYTCTVFTATVTGKTNLTNPQFCIVNAAGNNIPGQPCNTTGIFTNLPYGVYKIKVTDGCLGSTMTVTVNGVKRTRSVNGSIGTSAYTCSTFTAVIGGATNLTNPQYCLVDGAGHQIACNSTGIFTNVPYGSYCINVTDACGDTTIKRCIDMTKPAPSGGTPSISDLGCNGYTIKVTGQKNIFNGQYCLLDANGNTLMCNATGLFTNVPYGKVCVKTTDGCTNGVFTSCITTAAPVPSIGPATVVNLSCSTFKATITGQQNLVSPQYCLFDQQGHQVGACNTTGVFTITGYGNYTIKTTDGCTGKVFTTPISAPKPVAFVDANLKYSNQTCFSFSVSVTGQVNLAGAVYKLKDNGTVVATSTNGVFNNVLYGTYCIDITNACGDTTTQRCFTIWPPVIVANATATPSCTYNATDIAVKVTAGTAPYQVKVYDTVYNLITSASFSGTTTTVKGVPSLSSALKYKVVVMGACGIPDTVTVAAQPSQVQPTYSVTPQCPSSVKADGSGTLVVTATSNLSGLNVSITQQDFSNVSISYSFKSGNSYTFSNLDAGTYVLTYTFSGCSMYVNDTTVIPKYVFPSLGKSSAYQCDNSSFSVGAAVTGGIGPYKYEIIASSPSTPSVVAAPQTSPIFNINNNTKYNLIRLRAVDACGNSALNDVSILPLANTIVTASSNCINQGTTLTTDALPNATYAWYKKSKTGDSVLLATGTPTYTISNVKFADTGLYVAKTTVNAGCLTKISYFRLTGTCGAVLPMDITLEGKQVSGGNQLSWTTPVASGIGKFELQRSSDANAVYVPIANIPARAVSQQDDRYTFVDNHPEPGSNLYRLHILYDGGGESYTNSVELGEGGSSGPQVSAYPNPVDRVLNVKIQGEASQRYMVALYNVIGQPIFTRQVSGSAGVIQYHRDATVAKGLYILKIFNMTTGAYNTYKIQFK